MQRLYIVLHTAVAWQTVNELLVTSGQRVGKGRKKKRGAPMAVLLPFQILLAAAGSSALATAVTASPGATIKPKVLQLAALTDRGQRLNPLIAPAYQETKAAMSSLLAELSASGSSLPFTEAALAGEWELVYSECELFRSSPFFLAIEEAASRVRPPRQSRPHAEPAACRTRHSTRRPAFLRSAASSRAGHSPTRAKRRSCSSSCTSCRSSRGGCPPSAASRRSSTLTPARRLRHPSAALPRPFRHPSETLPRPFRDPSATLPRPFRDSSATLPRPFCDPSETLPRPFRDPSETLPRSPLSLLPLQLESSFDTTIFGLTVVPLLGWGKLLPTFGGRVLTLADKLTLDSDGTLRMELQKTRRRTPSPLPPSVALRPRHRRPRHALARAAATDSSLSPPPPPTSPSPPPPSASASCPLVATLAATANPTPSPRISPQSPHNLPLPGRHGEPDAATALRPPGWSPRPACRASRSSHGSSWTAGTPSTACGVCCRGTEARSTGGRPRAACRPCTSMRTCACRATARARSSCTRGRSPTLSRRNTRQPMLCLWTALPCPARTALCEVSSGL